MKKWVILFIFFAAHLAVGRNKTRLLQEKIIHLIQLV